MRSARGFTLIEIMVVLAIAATLTTLVILRLGSWQNPDDPERILERIAARITHQCEQALFQSRPRGLRFSQAGYDAWQGGPEGWLPLPEQGPDQAQSIPRSLTMTLELSGYRVDLTEVEGLVDGEDDDSVRPQVVCHPLGELTPFRLTLSGDDGKPRTLEGDASGRLTLLEERI